MKQFLRVVVFEGVQNLPIFVGQERGFFSEVGIDVDLTFTPNSWSLRDGLANGTFDFAHTAVDNAIAMVEMAKQDVAIVMGGDNGFNHLFLQPDLKTFEDLRNRVVLVDAPDTAFALVLYGILEKHGLSKGDYRVESVGATPLRLKRMREDRSAAASIMNLPFVALAKRAGLRLQCHAIDEIGPYLSTTGFVMRQWARAHSELVTNYIRGYVAGLRWANDPENRDAAIETLARRLSLSHEIAAECYSMAVASGGGLAVDAHLDIEGLIGTLNVRALNSKAENLEARNPAQYLDLSYHAAALDSLV